MNMILEGVDIVAFDIMGVILSNPSLIREGLYPIYKDRFSYEYIKGLYNEIRSNVDGDSTLWRGLGVEDIEISRKLFLDKFELESTFEEFRNHLSEKSIRKGVISNMPAEWGDYFAKKFNLVEDFDPILLSGDIGIDKSDYRIYNEFLNRAGVKGENILFIDDKLSNLEMAKRFSFKTVLFDRGKEQEGFKPDLIIKSFKELM